MNGKIIGLALALAALPTLAQADTFRDVLSYTQAGNPGIKAQEEALEASRELKWQAWAGWQPNLTLTGSWTASRNGAHANDLPVAKSNDHALSGAAKLTQNVFAGFGTVNSSASASHMVSAAEHALDNYRQTVLLSAAKMYAGVIQSEATLALRKNNESLLRQELTSARNRFRVGQITRTDVSQSEARLSGATSQRIGAQGDLESAQAGFVQVVGRMPEGTLAAVPSFADRLPKTLAEAVAAAEQASPALKAAQETAAGANSKANATMGGLLPSVDAYVQAGKGIDPTTINDDESHYAAAGLQASWSLYDSGTTLSKTRQDKRTANQRRMELDDARRKAVAEATSAWAGWTAAKAKIKSIQDQISAAQLAASGVKREATAGARTTLDVLNAEQELLDARVSLVVAQRDEAVAALTLMAAIGKLNLKALGF
ncbi:type I secretion protein TolC [Alphaproteobacteria bacterium]|nr:type I secretion protein TolC [Alphaproteobacteria bacterium]